MSLVKEHVLKYILMYVKYKKFAEIGIMLLNSYRNK